MSLDNGTMGENYADDVQIHRVSSGMNDVYGPQQESHRIVWSRTWQLSLSSIKTTFTCQCQRIKLMILGSLLFSPSEVLVLTTTMSWTFLNTSKTDGRTPAEIILRSLKYTNRTYICASSIYTVEKHWRTQGERVSGSLSPSLSNSGEQVATFLKIALVQNSFENFLALVPYFY